MTKTTAMLPWLGALAILSACGGSDMAADNSWSLEPANEMSAPIEGVYCPAVEQRVSSEDCEALTRADAQVRPGAAAFNVPDPMLRGETVEVHLVIDRRAPLTIRTIEGPRESDPAGADSNMTNGNTTNGDVDANAMANGHDTSPGPGGEVDASTNAAAPPDDDPPPTPGQIVEELEGTPERFYPLVGRHMRAELTGQGFDIVARTETSQEIPLGGQATWIWDVTAREGGTQSLTAITAVEGVTNGRRFVLARTPKVRTVTVEVSWRDWIWDAVTGAPAWIKALTAVVVALGGFFAAWRGLGWRRPRDPNEKDRSNDKQDEAEDSSGGEP